MARNPFQWFPFYATDWLSDERVQVLPLACQGAYLRLLCVQWIEGSIPANDQHLAKLLGISLAEWLEISHEIRQFFVDNSDGRLENKRLARERGARLRHHKRLSNAGKVGAKVTNNRQYYNGVSGQAEARPTAWPKPPRRPGSGKLESESESESDPNPSSSPHEDEDFVPAPDNPESSPTQRAIDSLEELSGLALTPDDRSRIAAACAEKSPAQIAEAIQRIESTYRAGNVKSLPRYAASVIRQQGPVRTERDAEEAQAIRRAQRLCADLDVPWANYHVQALEAVTKHNGAVKGAIEATWADYHAKQFSGDSSSVWWDRFAQHLESSKQESTEVS